MSSRRKTKVLSLRTGARRVLLGLVRRAWVVGGRGGREEGGRRVRFWGGEGGVVVAAKGRKEKTMLMRARRRGRGIIVGRVGLLEFVEEKDEGLRVQAVEKYATPCQMR